MSTPLLTELQRIRTSGARAVEPFSLAGDKWLAIPQLAADAEGSPAGINGGTSDTEVLLLRDSPHGFVRGGALPVGGGEDVEAFRIGGRTFLAVASIRTGSGPYEFATSSQIFEAHADGFRLVQSLPTYAAKQFRHFTMDGAHFLGVAQNMPSGDVPSTILRWDGARFQPWQELESVAGYNIAVFDIEGRTFLAHADHAAPSRLYRLDQGRFVEHQELVEAGGRAFLLLQDAAGPLLAVARIDADSPLLRWDGDRFTVASTIPGGPGGREFARVTTARGTYVVRVEFIHGTPADPQPDLQSHVYRLQEGALRTVGRFPTTGATDVAVLHGDGEIRIAVSNGLAARPEPGATFTADSVIYRFDDGGLA